MIANSLTDLLLVSAYTYEYVLYCVALYCIVFKAFQSACREGY